VVVLIGRDENLKRRKYRRQVFPYFYLRTRDYEDIKDCKTFKDWNVQKVEQTSIRDINKQLLTKIFVNDCDRIGDAIHGINKTNKVMANAIGEDYHSIYTYEADLSKQDLLPLRFLID